MTTQAEPPLETRLIPVSHWNDYHDWPPPGGLRYLIFHSRPRRNSRGEVIFGNGFANAFKRVGRRVLVDERAFWECVRALNEKNQL